MRICPRLWYLLASGEGGGDAGNIPWESNVSRMRPK